MTLPSLVAAAAAVLSGPAAAQVPPDRLMQPPADAWRFASRLQP